MPSRKTALPRALAQRLRFCGRPQPYRPKPESLTPAIASAKKYIKCRNGSQGMSWAASRARSRCLATREDARENAPAWTNNSRARFSRRWSAAAAPGSDNSSRRAGGGRPANAKAQSTVGRPASRSVPPGRLVWPRRPPIVEVVEDLVGDAEVPGEAADRLAELADGSDQADARKDGRRERRRRFQRGDLQGVQRRNLLVRASRATRSSAPWPSQSRVCASANSASTSPAVSAPSDSRPPAASR